MMVENKIDNHTFNTGSCHIPALGSACTFNTGSSCFFEKRIIDILKRQELLYRNISIRNN